MSDHFERAADLLVNSLDAEDGDERIATANEAVTAADLSGDYTLQFYTREQLVRASTFGGEPEKALVAFSWLLAHFDKRPDEVSEWSILWKYKWIISGIHEFPHISKARILEMFDDFEARATRAGFGLKAAYNFRYRFERFCGNRERAVHFFRRMDEMPEDDLSNCAACLLDEQVSYTVYSGDNDRAVALAAPILQGDLTCKSVPHRTYAKLLLPLVRLGRDIDAQNYHRAGYRLVRQNKTYLDRVAQHMIFLAATNQTEKGLTLFKKHVGWLEKTRNVYHHFLFSLAAWLLFEALAENGSEPLKIGMPKTLPIPTADGNYDPYVVGGWFKAKAIELASDFDRRNETNHFHEFLCKIDLSNARDLFVTL